MTAPERSEAPIDGPTRKEAEARVVSKEAQRAYEQRVLAAFRQRHPDSTCDDETALAIAEIEMAYGPRAPRPEPRKHCATCRCEEAGR